MAQEEDYNSVARGVAFGTIMLIYPSLVAVECGGGGNCGPAALALALYRCGATDTRLSHGALRKHVVNAMADRGFQELELSTGPDSGVTMGALMGCCSERLIAAQPGRAKRLKQRKAYEPSASIYVKIMRTMGTWADEAFFHATAEIFGCEIFTVTATALGELSETQSQVFKPITAPARYRMPIGFLASSATSGPDLHAVALLRKADAATLRPPPPAPSTEWQEAAPPGTPRRQESPELIGMQEWHRPLTPHASHIHEAQRRKLQALAAVPGPVLRADWQRGFYSSRIGALRDELDALRSAEEAELLELDALDSETEGTAGDALPRCAARLRPSSRTRSRRACPTA